MKITENFKGVVEKIKYNKLENTSKYKKEGDSDFNYLCNITIAEVGQGMAKFPQRHNVVINLTEEQFNTIDEESKQHTIIEKGDRINILTGAKWKSKPLSYKSYSQETISKADKSQLKVDEQGKTYWEMFAYAYTIHCKPEDWSMESKYYDQNYCTIFESGVKLPLESKKSFNADILDWYLDDNEKDKISLFDGKVCRVILYSNKAKASEKNMLVSLQVDNDNKTNYLLLRNAGE